MQCASLEQSACDVPCCVDEKGIGFQLKQAREQAGIDRGLLIERLKISPKQIDLFESDQLDLLPGVAFIRGVIRGYARVLQLDPAVFISMYEQQYPKMTDHSVVIVPSTNENIPFQRHKRRRAYKINWSWLLIGLSTTLLVVFMGIWPSIERQRVSHRASGDLGLPQQLVVSSDAPPVQPVQSLPVNVPAPVRSPNENP